jgi:two-component system alkaline phosphatase synthesis response regulator PhoP
MKRKVLVVDDEEVIRKFLKIHLGKWGYEVEEASDGEEAVGRLRRENLDLLISDVLMPRKDGWELLKEVRSNQRTRELPVILLTAKNEDTDMFKGYGLGANYYLTKPFTKAQLLYGVQLMFGGNAESRV